MDTGIHPIFTFAALGFIAAIVLGIFCFRTSSVVRRVILGFLAVVCLAPASFALVLLHPEWVDGRFRTYKAFYRDIREGMTRPDIDALLSRHYPPAGPRQRPMIMEDNFSQLGFFMNPETSREPNCEGIFLTLRDGQVIRKTYSPD